MKNKDLLLIDAMNLFYRSLYAYRRLTYNEESVAVIYGMPSLVSDMILRWRPTEVMIVWDGERSEFRKDLLPQYKEGRKKDRLMDWDNIMMQKKYVRKLFLALGVKQIYNKEAEADDMIYKITHLAIQKPNYRVRIVSSDKDFNQLITEDDRVWIQNEGKRQLIHYGNCKEHFGYNPDQCVDYLTLVGDKSDNIPGYPGIGEARATEFLEEFGSISNFLSKKANTFRNIDRDKLRAIVKRNYMLMDLSLFYSVNQDTMKTVFYGSSSPKFNLTDFREVCQKFGLRKFMGTGFTKNFKLLNG